MNSYKENYPEDWKRGLTVAEVIEKLKVLPQDMKVVICAGWYAGFVEHANAGDEVVYLDSGDTF